MTNDLRAQDAVADLVDGATSGGEENAEAAIEIVTHARSGSAANAEAEPEIEIGEAEPAREVRAAPKQPKMTKADALAALDKANQTLIEIQQRMQVLEARTDDKAINDLGATFCLAIQVAGDFIAANRGPHWSFPQTEAAPIGDAWAVVAAPYADKLKTIVPWALAIGVTWKSLKPRLDRDAQIVALTQRDAATTS